MRSFEERSTYFLIFSVTLDDKNWFEVLVVALSKNSVDLTSDGSCFELDIVGT